MSLFQKKNKEGMPFDPDLPLADKEHEKAAKNIARIMEAHSDSDATIEMYAKTQAPMLRSITNGDEEKVDQILIRAMHINWDSKKSAISL